MVGGDRVKGRKRGRDRKQFRRGGGNRKGARERKGRGIYPIIKSKVGV